MPPAGAVPLQVEDLEEALLVGVHPGDLVTGPGPAFLTLVEQDGLPDAF